MNSNDFVKYLTIQIVERLNNPKQHKTVVKDNTSLSYHLFGLIPLSIKILFKQFRKKV